MASLEEMIREFARSLGFSLVGIARATEADGFDRLCDWLAQGFSGQMQYMHRHAEARRHPESILPGVRSVMMVALEYGRREPSEQTTTTALTGKIARYAAGPDYHEIHWRQLDKLKTWLESERPGCRCRAVADTAPLMERDFARRAGLGWIGKNTMLINRHRGSYFTLGALLTDLELVPDAPHTLEHCGTCTACLDACPTDAFAGPGWLDSRKCISYLTIELREEIALELRSGIGDWLFGCDVCQEVCPWNRKDQSVPQRLDAVDLLSLDDQAFRQRFRGTALTRPKRRGLLRNAALVLGNSGDERAIPALERAAMDTDPLIREAAEWALAQLRPGLPSSRVLT